MIRKLFALLALVGLAASPSTGWATTWNTSISVNVYNNEGGTANADENSKSSDSSWTVSSATHTYKLTAAPAEGWRFVGWFTTADCSGNAFSPDDSTTYDIKITSTPRSGALITDPTNGYDKKSGSTYTRNAVSVYAKFAPAAQKTDLSKAVINLDKTELPYTGGMLSVSISKVTCEGVELELGRDYVEDSSSVRSGVGSASSDESFTVKINPAEDSYYTGSATTTWTIKAPSGSFDAKALETSTAGCAVDGTDKKLITVTDSTKLVYDANLDGWKIEATVAVPFANMNRSYRTYFTEAEVFAMPDEGSGTAKKETDKYSSYTYVKDIKWTIGLTVADIEKAKGEEKTELRYEMTAYALANGDYPNGCAQTTYAVVVPITNIVLNDQYGNQVYEPLSYVAENGASHKKYETLAAALAAATNAGETVMLIGNAEAGAFEIGPGVTLDLAGFGNAGASYSLKSSEDAGATLKSTKAETVSAITGYRVVTDTTSEPGVYIYTTELAHQHAWSFKVAEDGYTLVATCADPSTCTIEGAQLKMQLQGVEDKEYDGKGISPSVVDIDVGGNKFREVIEGVSVGEVTYTRPSYSADKWYTGAYTASCIVTIGEATYTLTKDFNILQKEYTDGFVALVDGLSVRFDTLLEAAGAANEGDTIYYRGGTLSGNSDKQVIFSSSKNITLDLGEAKVQRDKYENLTLMNSGAGTVTLTNGTIVQPKASSAGQMNIEGNFEFANIKTINRATNSSNFFTMTVTKGTLTVLGGQYMSQFKANGGSLVCKGGKFANRSNKFNQPTPATGCIVISCSGSLKDGENQEWELKWEVVEHTHHIFYSAAGNVITAVCDTNNHEHCGFGTQTVTLTAENAKTTGEAYAGAHVDVTAGFPVEVTDVNIVYYTKDDQSTPLPGAPIETGDYIAKVTAGGATAEKAFQIVHEHEFTFNAEGDTLTATCNAQGVCDAKTLTLTLVANSRDWKKATPFAASVTDGFGETIEHEVVGYAYYKRGEEEPLAAAPILTGEYTAKVTVTVAETPYVLTKDFAITKPAGGYTSGWEVKDGLCYDTFADAVAAASAGATIYWHDGGDTISDKTFNFNSANDITVDLCGKSFSQSGDSIRLSNSKAGVVTLTNGKVVQTGYTHSIQITGGKIVFGNDLSVYSIYKPLEVADGASLQIVGGKYSQYAKPDDYIKGLGDDYVILPLSETNYKYQVVPHAHKLAYTADANVITVVCTNENAAYCNYKPGNTEKLTLTAEDRQETGSAYKGASIDYSTKFPVKDAVIEYWVKDGEKLDGAPSTVGFYEARVTVGEATAVAPFEITHIHEFAYEKVDEVNIGVKCTVSGGSCDYQEVKTVTLNAADTKTFDGAAYAATFTKGEGFPSEDLVTVAIEYWVKNGVKLESAPSDVGSYTVKMIAAEGGTAKYTLEKDFAIVQADLANATIELNKESYAFNGQAQVNGIKTIKIGNYTLVEGTDYTKSGDDFSQVGSPAADCTYTVTFTPCGNFGGSPVAKSWTITAPTGEMGKLEEVKGEGQTAFAGELEGTTLTVTLTTNLCFLSGAWYAGLSVAVPNSIDGWSSDNSSGTNPDDLRIGFSHEGDLSQVAKDSHTWALSQKTITYAKSITWFAQFTLAEIAAAIEKGDTEIVRTMTVSAVPGTFNGAGIREVVYTIKLPLANLVLPVPAEKTLDAGDVAIDGFQLQLGVLATVTANAQVADFATKLIPDSSLNMDHFEIVEKPIEGAYQYTLEAKEFEVNYYDGDEVVHTDKATILNYTGLQIWNGDRKGLILKGYTRENGDPLEATDAALHAYIAAEAEAEGCDGVVKVFGTWEKPTITITIVEGNEITDVQMDGESIDEDLELPAGTTQVKLELEAGGLTVPVFKVVRGNVTNVTTKVATYDIKDGDTLEFFAEEADETDPTVDDDQIKTAIIDAIDEPNWDDDDDVKRYNDAKNKVEAVVGDNADQVSAKEFAAYINKNSITSEQIADCDYVAASVKLDTEELITDENTEIEFVEDASMTSDGFVFELDMFAGDVWVDLEVEAVKDYIANSCIQTTGDLGTAFEVIGDPTRVTIDDEGKVTITPAEGKTAEFFKIVIPSDK